jgi:hypothetical protein
MYRPKSYFISSAHLLRKRRACRSSKLQFTVWPRHHVSGCSFVVILHYLSCRLTVVLIFMIITFVSSGWVIYMKFEILTVQKKGLMMVVVP